MEIEYIDKLILMWQAIDMDDFHIKSSGLKKGHLLVIPLLFKGKTIQNLGQPMHSYELIPLNIFVGMSFLVFGG